MAMLAAVAITAAVVAVITWLVTQRVVTASFAQAVGGRSGVDPVDEHQRLLNEADSRTTAATAQTELLQLALDNLTSGAVVTDLAGKILVRNRLASEMTTRSHEQTLIDAATTELLSAATGGEAAETEVEVFGPPTRTLFIHAVPIETDGLVVGALAVIDDVTDHHRIEKTRRDFVANLSHELRTPVGAASLLGEMLIDEDDAAVRQQLTDRLLIETDRMAATIDDLLELSRIESDGQTFDEIIEISSLVDEALARTRVAAETKQVRVASVLPSEGITLTGNRDQLLTALVNLVENAVKYSSPEDSVSVRARRDADVVHLLVQDTGRGIPARELNRIFERFYRVDRSRDSNTGGTGIGLSIVHHVALNHGGTVEVSSFEGEGSTFTLVLPRSTKSQTSNSPAKHEVG